MHAVFSGDLKTVQTLIKYGANIHHTNYIGRNVLHIACNQGDFAMIQYLIDVSPSLLDQEDDYGNTPFFIAVMAIRKQQIEIVKFLLEKGVDPNWKNRRNRTCLDCITEEYKPMIEFFHERRELLNEENQKKLNRLRLKSIFEM